MGEACLVLTKQSARGMARQGFDQISEWRP